MKQQKQTTDRKRIVLVVLPLAYQDGRDRYVGFLQYLATHRPNWNIHLVRECITRHDLRREIKGGIDGILTCADTVNSSFVPLIPAEVPCVVMDAVYPERFETLRRLAFVDVDSTEIGRLGAKCLTEHGSYTAYGIVGFEEVFHWSQTRMQNFCGTLAEKGLDGSVLHVKRANIHETSTHRTMYEWAAKLHRPAAVMAVTDELARQFIEALSAHGLNSPQDIAVLGVDNEWILCTHMSPTLSSIQPDFERSGYLAAECLARLLSADTPRKARETVRLHMTSPVKSVARRESTAPSNTTGLTILRAEEFIRDHSDGGIRPDDVARHLGISRRLLDLRFRAITGKTVLEAIQEEQLNRVRDLLRTTSLSITEISNRCNFRSENHLKRLFKNAFGMTMRDYRKSTEYNGLG